MKKVEITPTILRGTVNIPPSKSMSHRAIFCAALSDGISNIKNVLMSKDIIATCKAVEAIGCKIKYKKADENKELYNLRIQGRPQMKLINEVIDCEESGSTLRFIIPLLATLNNQVTVTGKGRLVSRPLDTYYHIFDEHKIYYTNKYGELPLTINGRLTAGEYSMQGDVSSQFITGMLFALPLLKGNSKLIITTELESKPYVDMTIEMLKKFGVNIVNEDYQNFYIKGSQEYIASDYTVEGDYSQAAFWLTAGILGGELYSNDIKAESLQGDKVIVDIIEEMGGKIESFLLGYKTSMSSTKGVTIDASQCPDLVPILSVIGATSGGITEIVNAKRLRIKESDRLQAITQVLTTLGADIVEYTDGLIIRGKEKLIGGEVDSHNDHRIAMAVAIASIKCEEKVIITNSQSIEKSYPNFWEDFVGLGGKLDELDMGE
ncbi:3-phosphoshikimate 1-carboxyvinyltransferase [Alkalibaculum sp. M08DMB]|uniref:3-phosphoshikimate 1-carboxyvinyltransferase n=1 Tax=Alkalibaculum sporogenes TaxID=2655001 RepID=A0A6A7KA25_9FIRM|nr:3-phosphoshikimate 1-carboxyvinyltransferase [Alkalibaculum sporogenes]MPW26215.1 3-phosphoshikimate 1-carboxyvinyltransferase [Alkalibaculum sporogenes]